MSITAQYDPLFRIRVYHSQQKRRQIPCKLSQKSKSKSPIFRPLFVLTFDSPQNFAVYPYIVRPRTLFDPVATERPSAHGTMKAAALNDLNIALAHLWTSHIYGYILVKGASKISDSRYIECLVLFRLSALWMMEEYTKALCWTWKQLELFLHLYRRLRKFRDSIAVLSLTSSKVIERFSIESPRQTLPQDYRLESPCRNRRDAYNPLKITKSLSPRNICSCNIVSRSDSPIAVR